MSTTLLAASAALAQAHYIPPLPILSTRDPLTNTSTPAPAGGNSTYPGINTPSDPAYAHSAAWKLYIAFLVVGAIMAVAVPVLGGACFWFRVRRGKGKKQKGDDVEMSGLSKMKARAMVEGMMRPQNAHVRPGRY